MHTLRVSKRKADALSNGAFLIGLGILFYTQAWWPGILLVLWVTIAIREYLTGRFYDLMMSTFLLVGLFLAVYLQLNWSVLLPVLFVLGGIFVIFREYSIKETEPPIDTPADLEPPLDEEDALHEREKKS